MKTKWLLHAFAVALLLPASLTWGGGDKEFKRSDSYEEIITFSDSDEEIKRGDSDKERIKPTEIGKCYFHIYETKFRVTGTSEKEVTFGWKANSNNKDKIELHIDKNQGKDVLDLKTTRVIWDEKNRIASMGIALSPPYSEDTKLRYVKLRMLTQNKGVDISIKTVDKKKSKKPGYEPTDSATYYVSGGVCNIQHITTKGSVDEYLNLPVNGNRMGNLEDFDI